MSSVVLLNAMLMISSMDSGLVLASATPPTPPTPLPPGFLHCWENASLVSLPFCDSALGGRARAKDLVARMTLQKKLSQLLHSNGSAITRLGVEQYNYHSEGLHGIRSGCKDILGVNTTLFPQVTGMAATGNMPLVLAMASTMGDEARALNNIANGTTFGKGTGLNYWGQSLVTRVT